MTAKITEYFPLDTVREKQDKALNFIETALSKGFRDIVIAAPTGCHAKGQLVMLADGSSKPVEKIQTSDKLMGPDGSPRKVLRLIRGHGRLYKVVPKKGNTFTVNDDHVLCLQRTQDGYGKAYKKITISVNNYLKSSRTFKHIHKLYRPDILEFSRPRNLEIPPYIFGCWIGDGTSAKPEITTPDAEVKEAWTSYVQHLGLKCRVYAGNNCEKLAATTGIRGGDPRVRTVNILTEKLKKLRVLTCKKIPRSYMMSSAENRLELLAGLLDTDGSLSGGVYDFISKRKSVADAVVFLCGSLGLMARITQCSKRCQTGAVGEYYRVCISGNIDKIPCRIPRKKANPRQQKKNVLRYGFYIVSIGEGNYYGFNLDKDHLYLLDDFTVTHNSGKTAIGTTACNWAPYTQMEGQPGGYYLVGQKLLQNQIEDERKRYHDMLQSLVSLKSASEYPCPEHGNCAFGSKPKRSGKCCQQRRENRCLYKLTKDQFLKATVALTNYAYFFTERYYQNEFPARQVLIADECHTLERTILSFVDLGVSEAFLQELQIQTVVPQNIHEISEYVDWINSDLLPEITTQYSVCSEMAESGNASAIQREHKMQQYLNKVTKGVILITKDPENWVFWSDFNRDKKFEYYARPLDAAPYFRELVTNAASTRIYMSAFPGRKDIFCRSLGLEADKVAWCSLSSTFPVENRKVIAAGVGSMSKRNNAATMPSFLRVTKTIMDRHKDEKGIIHTVSYQLGEHIFNYLKTTEHCDRLLFPRKAEERDEIFQRHKDFSDPTVIITPSMTEGFDFADDLARFQIISKCPYAFLGDKQVVAKKDRDPDWYILCTVMSIVQACGRIVRSDTDRGTTYILDSDFNKLFLEHEDMFPNWWKKSLSSL
jgi:hypothetical protein